MEELIEIFEELKELVYQRKTVTLRNKIVELNPADVALFIGELEEKDIPLVYRILPKDFAGEVFSYMEVEEQQLLIHSFSDVELKATFDELWLDDMVDIIEEMPANVVARILQSANPSLRKQINELLNTPRTVRVAL